MGHRRVNGKLVEKPEVVVKDGHRLAVLRPMTQEAADEAMRRAHALVGKTNTEAEFEKIITDQCRMTFMGLMGKRARVLHPVTLEDLGPCLPGDSFVSYEEMLKAPPEAFEPPS